MEAIGVSALLGSLASALAQIIKKYVGVNMAANYAIVALVSLAVAFVYMKFETAGLLPVTLQVLAWAGAVYTFILSRFSGASVNP